MGSFVFCKKLRLEKIILALAWVIFQKYNSTMKLKKETRWSVLQSSVKLALKLESKLLQKFLLKGVVIKFPTSGISKLSSVYRLSFIHIKAAFLEDFMVLVYIYILLCQITLLIFQLAAHLRGKPSSWFKDWHYKNDPDVEFFWPFL